MASKSANPHPGGAERLAAAGYAGSREFANQFGLSLAALEQMGRLSARQLRWFVEDQRESFEQLATTLNPFTTAMDHLVRRSRHVQSGIEEFADTLRDFAERSESLRGHLWGPFAEATGVANVTPFRRPGRRSVLQRLHDDHRHLAVVLDALETLADDGAPPPARFDLLRAALAYVADYPDAVHHPLEDRLFDHLLAADLSVAERDDVTDNARRHGDLIAATQALRSDLQTLRDPGDEEWEPLRLRLRDFIGAQREHMRFEERRVFPLAERKLSARALREIATEDGRGQDPLFDDRLERFAALYDYVSGRL